jgi:hypothetical protein
VGFGKLVHPLWASINSLKLQILTTDYWRFQICRIWNIGTHTRCKNHIGTFKFWFRMFVENGF